MHDGTNAVCPDNGPNEEGNPSRRDEIRLSSEEMADLVNWEPYRRQAAEPKQEEAGKVPCVCS